MQEFKGTPGPWHVMRGDVLDKNGRMVASVEGFCPGENDTYDAELIASAPEMLEALQLLMAEQTGGNKSCGHNGFTCMCPYDKARAAIAKALGK
ncbi:hypothetical protein [Klebsiella pneumoniae]|uniref:hypothetical protein n=1 Tax=Klebsiella pneumoniae TaxID=573 RepID=UPI00115DB59A|nr:hypothetical protein [Klebsiella pneumoniae]MCQ8322394.1 hypothetical protein [Klebsiella pneumoniae]HBR2411226.1 hypothetical protein [Klebsiella pneumoniae]HBR2430629.1 hypothetical protein [Klebsiella pneumoniae]HBU1528819.1 hypothetical protein [Klebsiella pneumoniae]